MASPPTSTADHQRSVIEPAALRKGSRVSARLARQVASKAPLEAKQKQRFRARELAIQFEEGTPSKTRVAIRARHGVIRYEAFGEIERWFLPKAGAEEATARVVAREPGIAVATTNGIYQRSAAPNDPSFGSQWWLDQPNDHDIDAPEGWAASDALATAPVTVAVLDSGIDLTHPDLTDQLWKNRGEYGPDGNGGRKESNGVDDDFNEVIDDVHGFNAENPADPPMPRGFHGTYVAGIIAAQRGNSIGTTGVSKQARLMALRATNDNGGFDEASLTMSVKYAVDNGASIVNGSLGGSSSSSGTTLLDKLVVDHPNVLFVFAAGNDVQHLGPGGAFQHPCGIASPNVICVSATDQQDVLASFSNYGPSEVDIAAPGVSILSTSPGGGYVSASGTSAATPVVTGVAAVLRSRFPSLSPAEIKDRLMRSADTVPSAGASASGRVNLEQAFSDTASTQAPAGTASVGVTEGLLTYAAAAGSSNGVRFDQVGSAGSVFAVTDSTTQLLPGAGCTSTAPTRVQCSGVVRASFTTGDLYDSIYSTVAIPMVIDTGAGPSHVLTGTGKDQITTGSDVDIIDSGAGDDLVTSGSGADAVRSGGGNDKISSGDGDDLLQLGDGDDIAQAGGGNDGVLPDAGDDTIEAGSGDDLVFGMGVGADRAYGESGNDRLELGADGDVARDVADGGAGADILVGTVSDQTFVGGTGIDTVMYHGDVDRGVTAQIGTSTGNGYNGRDSIGVDIEILEGSKGADTLIGSANADALRGAGGDDRVEGRGGSDILDEDLDTFGNDELIGGDGVDTVDYGRSQLAAEDDDADGGVVATLDGVRNDGAPARGEQDLIANDVEGLYGGRRADVLSAGASAAILDGGPGADTLSGGPLGDSIYAQDAGADTIVCGAATDFIRRDDADSLSTDCEFSTLVPHVRITGDAPAGGVTDEDQPAFTFVAGAGPDATFTCRVTLTGATAGTDYPCQSGWRPPVALTSGDYTFLVQAKLPSTAAFAASRAFRVDTVDPGTGILSGPSPTVTTESVTLTLGSSEPATYECRIDDGLWRDCVSPVTLGPLADGPHTVAARARDAAGNADATPATRAFVVTVPGPQTTLATTPATPTALTTASFGFSSEPTGASFECKLDEGDWQSCGSPRPLTALAAGEHTFKVRGTLGGETDPTPATHVWTVDPTIRPRLELSGPAAAASWVNTAQPTFTFTADQQGVTFECAVGNAVYQSCSSPWTSPPQGESSSLVAYRFQVRNAAGVLGQKSYALRFDFTAPETTIVGGPAQGANVAEDKATFTFSGTDARQLAGFDCRVDGAAWTPCTSPYATPTLTLAQHVFDVRARDSAGHVDGTFETRTFTATTPVAPQTSWIGVKPSGSHSSDPSPTLRFAATPSREARFECAAGPTTSVPFVPCRSPWTVPEQPEGKFAVLRVRAIGPTGLVDPTPSLLGYYIDLTAPETTITGGPETGSTVTTSSPSFAFSGPGEPSSTTYECKVDDEPDWTACTSPKSLTSLPNGEHTFSVRSRDAARNPDPTPAARTITIAA